MKIYGVRKGYKTGVFMSWAEAQNSIKGFKGAEFKGFSTIEEAERYISGEDVEKSGTNKKIGEHFEFYVVKDKIFKNYNMAKRISIEENFSLKGCMNIEEATKYVEEFKISQKEICEIKKESKTTLYSAEELDCGIVEVYTTGAIVNGKGAAGYQMISPNGSEYTNVVNVDVKEGSMYAESVAIIKAISYAEKCGYKSVFVHYSNSVIYSWATKGSKCESGKKFNKLLAEYSARIKIALVCCKRKEKDKIHELARNKLKGCDFEIK